MTNIFDKFFIGLSKIVNLEDMLSKVKETKEQGYYRLSLDLSAERNDEEIPIRGSFIGILDYNGDNTGCSFKLNSKNAPSLYASEVGSIPQIVSKIYLTNTAQASKTLVLLVSTSPFGMSTRKTAIYNVTGDDVATATKQDTINTTLTTMDAVLDNILSDTASMDGDLDSLATKKNDEVNGPIGNATKTCGDSAGIMIGDVSDEYVYLIIQCKTNPAKIGDSNDQYFEMDVDDTLVLEYVNPSNIYVKNKNAGNNAVLNIFYKTKVV